MTYLVLPGAADVAGRFIDALGAAQRVGEPFRRWTLANVLPEAVCVGVLTMPVAPPALNFDMRGERGTYNTKRTFFTPGLRKLFPVAEILSAALQEPDVARRFEALCGVNASGAHLRVEYIQDLNGMWLKPYRSIPEKLLSMELYLCTGPYVKDWGSDFYDDERKWVDRGEADFNTAVIFDSNPKVWRGFDLRPIHGVRRLLEISYVRDWRDRDQLAYPEQPVLEAEAAETLMRPSAA
jgi:hypothetical protein